MHRIRHHEGVKAFAVLAVVGFALTGCTSGDEESEAQPLPTPIEVIAPDSGENCTTSLEMVGPPSLTAPNTARIECGDSSAVVEGTFEDGYTNIYNPGTTFFEAERIVVVGGEVRAWLRYGGSTCLVVHTPGEPPTECKPTAPIG